MEPDFTRLYQVVVKKWKPSTIEDNFIGTLETIRVFAQDIEEACRKGEEYAVCVKANSDWVTTDIVSVVYQDEVFIGIEKEVKTDPTKCQFTPQGKEWKCTRERGHPGPCAVVPQTGILNVGFKGYPCCHE